MKWILIAALGLVAAGPAPAGREVWLVFSPKSPLPFRNLRAWPKPDRVVLAIENFRTGRLPDSFLQSVRGLRSWLGPSFALPVVDPEAIAVVRKLAIRRLPALVVFERRRIHIYEGIPKEPFPCDR